MIRSIARRHTGQNSVARLNMMQSIAGRYRPVAS